MDEIENLQQMLQTVLRHTQGDFIAQAVPSAAETAINRFTMLEQRVDRLERIVSDELWRIKDKAEAHEERLNALLDNGLQPPQYIQQLQEDMKWLKARCDDIQRIFSFDTMILNGISKQGE